MRISRALFVVGFCAPPFLAASPRAYATFHLMQIEQVIGGVSGDTDAQAIQLRMRSNGQEFVSAARLRIWDSAGNPTLLLDLTTSVTRGETGSRILIATPAFIAKTLPNAEADFQIPNGSLTAILASGSLTFEDDLGTVLWRLTWGNASYTGPTTGGTDNDQDGQFGPGVAGALPSAGLTALIFNGAATAPSTNNAADYGTTPGAAVFTNNAGCTYTVDAGPACGAVDSDMDGTNDDCDACTDTDGDGAGDPGFATNCLNSCPTDNCPAVQNASQGDADNDGIGDACDTCTDADGDGFGDPGFGASTCPVDNCAGTANPGQEDGDGDGRGDVCDNCPALANADQANADSDARGDACDNCPGAANSDQADADGDGTGDACEAGAPGGDDDGNPDDGGGPGGSDGACGTMGGCAGGMASAVTAVMAGLPLLRRRVRRHSKSAPLGTTRSSS